MRIAYHRLGDYYGHKRLYLETLAASEAGFTPGTRFSISVNEERRQLRITIDPTGPRTVTRRERPTVTLPVIDIKSLTYDDVMRGAERARVSFGKNEIIVDIHHDHVAEAARLARLDSRLANNEPLAVLSLCSGAGILDHAVTTGLADAGIPSAVKLAVEIDDRAIEAAIANNPVYASADIIHGRIEDVEMWPSADILIAGLPCVGASLAGRAARHGDAPEEHPDAGALYLQFILAVQQSNPAAIVFENVASYRNTESMAAIRSFLNLKGYAIHERILTGTDFGDLERRTRMTMIAVSRGIAFDPDAIVAARTRPASLGAVLETIAPDSPLWQTRAHIAAKLVRDKEKGNNFKPQPIDATSEACPTISAGYTRWRTCDPRVQHPDGDGRERLLTVAEHAAIKGVPLGLLGGMTDSHAHQVLGNSVTHGAWVAVGRALGGALRAAETRTEPLRQLSFI